MSLQALPFGQAHAGYAGGRAFVAAHGACSRGRGATFTRCTNHGATARSEKCARMRPRKATNTFAVTALHA